MAKASGTGPFTYQWNTGGTNDTINVSVPDTTTFTVVISNGCPITKTVKVIPYYPSIGACCTATINIGGDTYDYSKRNRYQNIPVGAFYGLKLRHVYQCYCYTNSNHSRIPWIGTDAEGCEAQTTVTIYVETPCFNFTVPNVFTPTSGGTLGLDKKFYIKTDNINAWSIVIFDRWGKEMFNSTNPTQYWDGTTEGGGQAPAGIYYYMITGTCQNTTYKKDGFVQLIR